MSLFPLIFLFAALQTAPDPEATVLDEIVVIGDPLTWRLTVVVEDGADARSLIIGATSVRCGPARFRYQPFGGPRLCWARPERGETVTLSGVTDGRPARVEWSGCPDVTPTGDCKITLRADTVVTARFATGG